MKTKKKAQVFILCFVNSPVSMNRDEKVYASFFMPEYRIPSEEFDNALNEVARFFKVRELTPGDTFCLSVPHLFRTYLCIYACVV